MRLRWLAITFVFLGSIVAVYAVCHESGGAVDTIVGMCRRVCYGILFAVGFWGASHLLQRWMSQQQPRSTIPVIANSPPRPAPAFDTTEAASECRYRVRGFDRDTHFQTMEFVYADSPGKAQMKVELKGVEVESVERA